MKKLELFYQGQQRKVVFSDEESLLEALLEQKVPINHSCEGMASCGTCRILVTSGEESLPPRNELEQEMADDRGFTSQERLACQICPRASMSFRLPSD